MAKTNKPTLQEFLSDGYTLPKDMETPPVVETSPGGSNGDISKESAAPEVKTVDTAPDAAGTFDIYTSINQQIRGEGGTGIDGYNKIVESMKSSGGAANAFTQEELLALYEEAGADPSLMYEWSNHGGYTQSLETALVGGGTGQPVDFYNPGVWYYYDGTPRPVKEGTSGADEYAMSDGDLQVLRYAQDMYSQAAKPEDKAYWHSVAERLRAKYKYSGGADGSMYIPLGQLTGEGDSASGILSGGNNYGTGSGGTSEDRMYALLNAWQSAAQAQSSAAVDYAVQQAIAEYERMLQEAQPQFKAQAESVSLEEQQALDNTALYAEMRGDRGGIGQAQYSSIQNAAAQNRLAVQQAQTRLATDTAREIAEMRAQGEFEKADAALEITQEYLAKLMELERWAAEHQFSQEQFAAQMQRWEAEYTLEWKQLQLSQNRWQQEFNYENYMDSLKLSGSAVESESMDAAEIYRQIFEAGLTDADRGAIKAYLMTQGIDEELASAFAGAYVTSEYVRLRYGGPDSFGSGWSAEEWAKIMEAAEINLKRGLTNAFDENNMQWITSKISREQWVELCRLMEQYNFFLEDEQ